MGSYLDLLPKIPYDVSKSLYSTNYNLATNILFRLGVIRETLENTSFYYEFVIPDGERPETLAEKIYKNPQAHWIILYANNITDPQYGWPLGNNEFNEYIINKYGSRSAAFSGIHHYEKVIERTVNESEEKYVTRYIIDYDRKTDNVPDVPYDTYLSLPETQAYSTEEVAGKTITQIVYRKAVTNFEYEDELNEAKRKIKLIKPEYYSTIIKEFEDFVLPENTLKYLRVLR